MIQMLFHSVPKFPSIILLLFKKTKLINFYFIYLFLIYFIDFVQTGRERDRELESLMRECHRSAASCTPPTGDMPATKVHALDRNRTRDPSVPKPMLYPLSQTGFSRFCLGSEPFSAGQNPRPALLSCPHQDGASMVAPHVGGGALTLYSRWERLFHFPPIYTV
uniref:Uncharacterized protein n=1 Tax=Pipistrellus kuhlii TaxID=59472 RepID=A0A7J7UTJ6_PIPKU|nr:hypothetical protein mPipKuh1_008709 [Pipistrellus kuhlii]